MSDIVEEVLEVDETLDASVEAETLPNGWRGVIAGLDRPTGDNRYLATPQGGVRTREYPLILTLQHIGEGVDIPIGTVDQVWVEGGVLHGEGTFDLGSEQGAEAARKFVAGSHQFVSIHPDQLTAVYALLKQDGSIIDYSSIDTEEDYNLLRGDGAVDIVVFQDWRLAGLAVVSIPAYAEARIAPVYDYAMSTPSNTAIVAGVGGQVFNIDYFKNPNLSGPTSLTVDDNGRVTGHVALWDSCYQYSGIPEGFTTCTKPPRSPSNYANFHKHSANLGGGERIPCGVITYGKGHETKGSLRASLENLTNVANRAAKVVAGEDKFGVWVSGEILDEVRDRGNDILSAPLSGHWEPNPEAAGVLDMIGAHLVNVPGYRISPIVASLGDGSNIDSLVLTMRREDFPSFLADASLYDLADALLDRMEARQAERELTAAEAMKNVHKASVIARLEADAKNVRMAAVTARLSQ